MPKEVPKKISLTKGFELFEYEIILIVFLALRFAFKNILKFRSFFTEQPVFNLSDNYNIILGVTVLFFVLLISAVFFGRFLRGCEESYQKPVIVLAALFLACPAALPFLFDTKQVSGAQLLYPFALFIFAVFLAGIPVAKWTVPIVCIIYFVPVFHSSEKFFSVLHKGAILYVPLIILFLFLQMMKKSLATGKGKILPDSRSIGLLVATLIAGVGSYAYSYTQSYRWGEAFGATEQKIDLYLLIALLIVSPTIVVFGAVLYKAVKGKFQITVFGVFWRSQILLLPLFAHNYTGLWVPYLVISLSMLIFYSIWLKNPAMLTAVQKVGEFCIERQFIFLVILIAMASLSNVSSMFLSSTFQKIFSQIPY